MFFRFSGSNIVWMLLAKVIFALKRAFHVPLLDRRLDFNSWWLCLIAFQGIFQLVCVPSMVSMFYAISIFHLNRKQIDIRAPLKMLITSLIFALGMLTQIDYPKLHRFYHFMRCVVFLSYWLFERIKVISAIFDIYFDYCS